MKYNYDSDEEENAFSEDEKEDKKYFDGLKGKKEEQKVNDAKKVELVPMDYGQEDGIIQKKLKILVINGKESGENGENWTEAKALIENGTDNKVSFGYDRWQKSVSMYENAFGPNMVWKEEDEKNVWNDSALCYGKNGSAVKQLPPTIFIEQYAVGANVVVLLNSDEFSAEVLESKDLKDMLEYKKVISYGSGNKTLDDRYWKGEDSEKYVHLESKEGCKNLLECIQQRVDTDPNSNFKEELKVKKIKLINSEKVDHPIKKCTKKHGKGQKEFFDKIKKYAKKNPKKTGVAGFITIEELLGQLLFRKSIFGGILGYNSNPKEKDAKNVNDNKKDEKKSNKEVNNFGNQVK